MVSCRERRAGGQREERTINEQQRPKSAPNAQKPQRRSPKRPPRDLQEHPKRSPKRLTEAPKRRPRVHKRHSRVNRTNRQRLDICPTKPLEPPKCARRRASPSFLGWPRWLRPLWSSSPESSGIQKQIQIQMQMQDAEKMSG